MVYKNSHKVNEKQDKELCMHNGLQLYKVKPCTEKRMWKTVGGSDDKTYDPPSLATFYFSLASIFMVNITDVQFFNDIFIDLSEEFDIANHPLLPEVLSKLAFQNNILS